LSRSKRLEKIIGVGIGIGIGFDSTGDIGLPNYDRDSDTDSDPDFWNCQTLPDIPVKPGDLPGD